MKDRYPFQDSNGVTIGYISDIRVMTTHEWKALRSEAKPVLEMKIIKGRPDGPIGRGTYFCNSATGTITIAEV